jgi:hypothetical protein
MGIPAKYNDDEYKKEVITIPPVSSMLPVPRAKEASKECVGESRKVQNLTAARPPDIGARVPIKIVGGKPWSPGVYCNLRLMGNILEVAWERAFIRTLFTFIN